MPGAGRVKRRWLTSTVDKLFRAQQAATVTQRTDEIENNKSATASTLTAAMRPTHAIHVPDSRTRMEGIDPIDLFGRGDVDVNDSCMLVAADNQVTERLGLARLDLPPLDGDEISGQIDR
jgi:hypothetical protein